MQISNAEALVLGSRTLQEADVIVDFLTRDGKRSGVARGARKKFSRYAGQLQLLSKVRLEWSEKAGRDLVRIGDISTLRAAAPLHRDLESIMVSSYIADTLQQFAQEREDNDHLFRLLDNVIERLLAGEDRNLTLRYFEAWVLRIAGLFPPPTECPLCGEPLKEVYLAPASGALICSQCIGESATAKVGSRQPQEAQPGVSEVSKSAVEFLLRISREPLAKVGNTPPDAKTLGEVERICRTIRQNFLQDEIRSYRVMKQTLQREPFAQ